MSFLDSFKEVITKKPSSLDKPHFYKADSDARNQLEQLKEFYRTAPSDIRPQVEQDIRLLSYGISGEDNVAFELKNSFMPMIVLHDLHIEYEGLSAQIDFLVITNKFNLIIECKNLYGNIEVNSNGDFIRTTEFNGRYNREGIYSPITQITRHLEMIRKHRLANKKNILFKKILERYFYDFHKSVVVLANPKTIIDMKYAKKEIKEQIIRNDQLIDYIKKMMNERTKGEPLSEKEMFELADFFLSLHTPNTVDYTRKYLKENNERKENEPLKSTIKLEDTPLYKSLKQYRYETSKAEGVKPYYIYNNAQMEDLIAAMPKTLDDIKKISGFGDVKTQKYGNEILQIVKRHS